jgi:hypothetical protein
MRLLVGNDVGREAWEVVVVACFCLVQLGWPCIANAPSEMEEGAL